MALRLSEGLGLTRRSNFDFDSVRVFTVDRIVARPSGVRVRRLIESGVATCLDPGSDFINVGPGLTFEGEVIQADPLAVIPSRKMLTRCWEEAKVGLTFLDVVHAARPTVLLIAEQLHERCPERHGAFQIADVQLDVMKQRESPGVTHSG